MVDNNELTMAVAELFSICNNDLFLFFTVSVFLFYVLYIYIHTYI